MLFIPDFLTRTETPLMVGNLWVNVTFAQLFLQVAIATQEKYDDSL